MLNTLHGLHRTEAYPAFEYYVFKLHNFIE